MREDYIYERRIYSFFFLHTHTHTRTRLPRAEAAAAKSIRRAYLLYTNTNRG